jgi:hypothetical protein
MQKDLPHEHQTIVNGCGWPYENRFTARTPTGAKLISSGWINLVEEYL